jgi:polyphenol oxidase
MFGLGVPVIAAMSTRLGGLPDSPFGMNLSLSVGDDPMRVNANRETFFGSLGIPPGRLAFMHQVHGTTVVRVEAPGQNPSCDALMTNQAGLFLCVTVADCVPIFLLDREAHAVAVVHAGWRGTASRIVLEAIRAMADSLGVDPGRMEAFIGPSAGQCCYEVGDEVADAFDPTHIAVKEGRRCVDLKGANREQLVSAGIPAAKIEVSSACTIHGGEIYHSFRRDGQKSGRMMGVLGFLQP